jgi:hypothetical protein
MSVASLGNCSNATRTSSEVFCTGMYTHAIAQFFLLTCVRLSLSSPYTYDSRCCSPSPCSGLVFSPAPPPPTISTTLPELRRNLKSTPQAINHRVAAKLKSLIFPTPKRFTSRWMKNVLPPCAHFHSRVFLIHPLFSGTQGKKKRKKGKPVQPFVRPGPSFLFYFWFIFLLLWFCGN